MSDQLEKAIAALVGVMTAEIETLLVPHVRAAVKAARGGPLLVPHASKLELKTLYRHYKGGLYRRLFDTYPSGPGLRLPDKERILFHATVSTNGRVSAELVPIYVEVIRRSSEIEHTPIWVAYGLDYPGVVYCSLSSGELYVRERDEFDGEVDVGWGTMRRFAPMEVLTK